MITVKLDWAERLMAIVVGGERTIQDEAMHLKGAHGVDETCPECDLTGAIGEIALAKHFGVFWSGTVGQLNLPDVGDVQVRATTNANGNLFIAKAVKPNGKPGDNPNHRFYFAVVRRAGYVDLHGWILGREAQVPEFWKDPSDPSCRPRLRSPSYVVPRGRLHDMSE